MTADTAPDGHRSRAYYDAFSAGYERERARGYHALVDDLELSAVLPLARGARVLEVGCGTGLLLGRLASTAREAVGVDLSPGMVGLAAGRGLRVALGSATNLPFRDASFDVACSFKVLPHVPDLHSALAELARVTRPGGHVVVDFYNPVSLRFAAKRLAGPQPISADRTEADVFTRWVPPWKIASYLPPELTLQRTAGVRIWTPAAIVHRVPLLGGAVRALERASVGGPFRHFAGFVVAVLRRA